MYTSGELNEPATGFQGLIYLRENFTNGALLYELERCRLMYAFREWISSINPLAAACARLRTNLESLVFGNRDCAEVEVVSDSSVQPVSLLRGDELRREIGKLIRSLRKIVTLIDELEVSVFHCVRRKDGSGILTFHKREMNQWYTDHVQRLRTLCPPETFGRLSLSPTLRLRTSQLLETTAFQKMLPLHNSDTMDIECTSPKSQAPLSKSLLQYQIPSDVAQATGINIPQKVRFYSHELYRGPNGRPPAVHYCRNWHEAERIARLFANQKLLGMDLEWKSKMPKGHIVTLKESVSMLQLASEDHIALFHIALFSQTTGSTLIPPTLKTILQSRDILKVGANIKGDCTRLRTHLDIQPNGIMELSHLYKIVRYSAHAPEKINKVAVKLADQVEEHLGFPLDKPDVRTSDWSRELNTEQKHYAAADAYCAVHLYDTMNRKRLAMMPMPKLPEIVNYSVVDAVSKLEPFLRSKAVEAWLTEFLQRKGPDYKVMQSLALRIYASWFCDNLDVEDMQSLQKSMTMTTTSIAYFLLDVIRREQLPFDPARTRKVLDLIPPAATKRYQEMSRMVEDRLAVEAIG